MSTPNPRTIRSIDELVLSIRALREPIESLDGPFRDAIERLAKTLPDATLSADYWVLVAHADALVRTRLFTEQNFSVIETIGLLGVSRYLFELVVWLRLMQQDKRYGLVYYHELAEKQRRYYTDLRDHLTREVALLKAIGDEEQRLSKERLAAAQRLADPKAVAV